MSARLKFRQRLWLLCGLLLLLLACMLISMNTGKMALHPREVFDVLLGHGTDQQNLVVLKFRLPRILLAVLVGIGMAVSGAVLQGLLRNDLADPGMLGINAGAGLMVLLYITVFGITGVSSAILLPSMSFAGGLLAALLIYLLAYRKFAAHSPTRLVLTGVAMNVGLGALTLFLTLKLGEEQYLFAQKWQSGYLWGDKWIYLAILAPWVLLLFLYIWRKSLLLNTLGLGHELAAGVGASVRKGFFTLVLAAVALASGSVALGGSIFFLGLICPHLARKLVGPDHKLMLPASALLGGIIMLTSDTLARTISFGGDTPAGIIVTMLSVPYFLYLLMR
jgi:iron complex transport system permease protein